MRQKKLSSTFAGIDSSSTRNNAIFGKSTIVLFTKGPTYIGFIQHLEFICISIFDYFSSSRQSSLLPRNTLSQGRYPEVPLQPGKLVMINNFLKIFIKKSWKVSKKPEVGHLVKCFHLSKSADSKTNSGKYTDEIFQNKMWNLNIPCLDRMQINFFGSYKYSSTIAQFL